MLADYGGSIFYGAQIGNMGIVYRRGNGDYEKPAIRKLGGIKCKMNIGFF
jgi:hypothetical protein